MVGKLMVEEEEDVEEDCDYYYVNLLVAGHFIDGSGQKQPLQ